MGENSNGAATSIHPSHMAGVVTLKRDLLTLKKQPSIPIPDEAVTLENELQYNNFFPVEYDVAASSLSTKTE